MGTYQFQASHLIASAFENENIIFNVVNEYGGEEIRSSFHVECGPNVIVEFTSFDNDNDVTIRISDLISFIPKEKRVRVIEACNIVNSRIRYLRFYVDGYGDLNVEYDLPLATSDESVGEAAVELFYHIKNVLDEEYHTFVKALYTKEPLS